MTRVREFEARAAVLICFLLAGLSERAAAATITNFLNADFRLHNLALNVGDTVVWVNQQPGFLGTNSVESYGGEWKSPPMDVGDSFSFTFTNAGFYAYRTGLKSVTYATGVVAQAGAVTVISRSGPPPAVTLNAPVEGSILSRWPRTLHASVTNEAGLAQIQYFANGTLVGTGTNAPYEVEWTPAPQGRYVLLAKAVDPDGGAAWSQPVNVTVGQDITVWGPRLLPTGELLSYYNAVVVLAGGLYMGSSDDVTSTNDALLTTVDVPGVFVDERVRGGMVRSRFYKVMSGQRLPP